MPKIFLTGDTHHSIEFFKKLSNKNFKQQKTLTKEDVVIILGDVGALTWDKSKETLYNIEWLQDRNFTTLFIDGNHDNFDILDNLPTEQIYGSEVGVLAEGVYHLKRGNIYSINGKTFLTIGGATSIDKEHRLPNRSWWEQETLDWGEEENTFLNLQDNDFKVDYILTHTIFGYLADQLVEGKVHGCPVSNFLDYVNNKTQFKGWFFGHFHQERLIKLDKCFYQCLYNSVVDLGNFK